MSEAIKILETSAVLREQVRRWKRRGLTVALVPTMGALHEGHLSLVRMARERADRVVTSIFVNPTQFGPEEDFDSYPRRPAEDAVLLAGAGCDLVFLPSVDTIYPPGESVYVDLSETLQGPSQGLEGAERPGHFRGVATVVTKLFNLVQPDLAVFGEKDAQQLAVVEALVRDLHLPVEIVAHPIVREPDGLAMSSRNAYLNAEQRRAAAGIHQVLQAAARRIREGQQDATILRRAMRAELAAEPLFQVDYAEVVDRDTFQPIDFIDRAVILPVAVRLGETRLLDNIRIDHSAAAPSWRLAVTL